MINSSNTSVQISLIVPCCLVTSYKKVTLKTTLPNIGLLKDVPASDTVVIPLCCLPFPACSFVQAATSLLPFHAHFVVQATIPSPGCDRSYRCPHTPSELTILDSLDLVSYILVPCRENYSRFTYLRPHRTDCAPSRSDR